jgi:hypothetical protein
MSVNNNLIPQARAVLQEVQREITSADDVLDQVEFSRHLSKSDSELYQLFGQRFIRNIQHNAKMKRAEAAVLRFEDFNLHTTDTIPLLAMGRFGHGNCEILCTSAAIKAVNVCNVLLVRLCENKPIITGITVSNKNLGKNHVVLILGAEETIFHAMTGRETIVDIVRLFSNSVLFDPFLKVICRTSEIVKTAPRFLEFLAVTKVKYLASYQLFKQPLPGAANPIPIPYIFETTAKMYAAAQAVFATIKLTTPLGRESLLPFLANTLNQVNALHTVAALQDLFPTTQWSHSLKHEDLLVSMRGTDAETKPVADRLKNQFQLAAKRFKMKTQNNKTKEITKVSYVVELTNPNPYQLRVISALSCLFTNQLDPLTKQVGGLTELIVHYAGE